MIEAVNLSSFRAYGFLGKKRQILKQVSFKVAEGTVCGFVGPNGAGKSTTIRHLVGVSRPAAGTVSIGGASPLLASTRARLGYSPELPSLPVTLTASELLRLHSRLKGVVDVDVGLLDRVGLSGRSLEPIRTFSKGMVQRLSLAVALVGRPEVIILDEPMSGLDPVGRELVRTIIQQENARGATIILSSHVLSDVARLCDTVVVIAAGKVVLDEPVVTGAVTAYDVAFEGGAEAVRVTTEQLAGALEAGRARGQHLLGVEPVRSSFEARVLSAIGGAP
ncbi:MAG: ABC transporter ATP-binding protein [Deltaproteobacteria bacterium]|nr:ABC transporter ATP-binding protein [Deltaproteobacteria bacterium]